MTDGHPREEANAKFEALEARLETRLTQLDSKISCTAQALDSKFDLVLQEVRHLGQILTETRDAARSKWNMVFASLGMLGVSISIPFGLWAIGHQIADLIKR